MKSFKELREKLLRDKKALVLIAVFLLGVIMLSLSGLSSDRTKRDVSSSEDERTAIENELEARAQRLLSSVDGVGKVRILVTVECINEVCYAKNEHSDLKRLLRR